MKNKVLNILAVDDDENILNLVRLYLGAMGHLVDVDSSPKNILSRTFRQAPDLIISDISMPEMSGFDFIRAFREKSLMKFVPLVFLTGHSEMEKISGAASLGALDYIVKPIEKGLFTEKIKRIIQRLSASEIHIKPTTKNVNADIKLKVSLTSVGVDFAKIISPFMLPSGMSVELDGHLYKEIGIKPGIARVEDCSPSENGFLVFIRFPQRTKSDVESVREWMNRSG